tara:strand:+ start:305 stop:448 length:144 start_codon:yes stop_codon:yes gene_type:complete
MDRLNINDIHFILNNHFACTVPSPAQYPKCFWYYLQLYKIERKENGN